MLGAVRDVGELGDVRAGERRPHRGGVGLGHDKVIGRYRYPVLGEQGHGRAERQHRPLRLRYRRLRGAGDRRLGGDRLTWAIAIGDKPAQGGQSRRVGRKPRPRTRVPPR